MKMKKIIQNVGRVIVMILALYSVHTMVACGGSENDSSNNDPGSGNNGGDNSDANISVPTGYGLYGTIGTINGLSVRVPASKIRTVMSVSDNNGNNTTDAGESLRVSIDQAGVLTDWAETEYGVSITIDDGEISNLSQIVIGTIYTLKNNANCIVGVITENHESTSYYDCDEAKIVFNSLNMPENGGITSGSFKVVLHGVGGELVGAFSDTMEFINPNLAQ